MGLMHALVNRIEYAYNLFNNKMLQKIILYYSIYVQF